jgi:hypothetical protein
VPACSKLSQAEAPRADSFAAGGSTSRVGLEPAWETAGRFVLDLGGSIFILVLTAPLILLISL